MTQLVLCKRKHARTEDYVVTIISQDETWRTGYGDVDLKRLHEGPLGLVVSCDVPEFQASGSRPLLFLRGRDTSGDDAELVVRRNDMRKLEALVEAVGGVVLWGRRYDIFVGYELEDMAENLTSETIAGIFSQHFPLFKFSMLGK